MKKSMGLFVFCMLVVGCATNASNTTPSTTTGETIYAPQPPMPSRMTTPYVESNLVMPSTNY